MDARNPSKSNSIRRMVLNYSVASLWLIICILHGWKSAAKKQGVDFSFYSALAICWIVIWLLNLRSCVRVLKMKWLWFSSIALLLAAMFLALMKGHAILALIAFGATIVEQTAILLVAKHSGLEFPDSDSPPKVTP